MYKVEKIENNANRKLQKDLSKVTGTDKSKNVSSGVKCVHVHRDQYIWCKFSWTAMPQKTLTATYIKHKSSIIMFKWTCNAYSFCMFNTHLDTWILGLT